MGFNPMRESNKTAEPYYVGFIMVVKKENSAGPSRFSGKGSHR